MQLLAKFKRILYMEFRATLNFRKFPGLTLTDFRTTGPWSAVCFLPLVCSLYFNPGLQSVFHPWSAVCILPLVCSLYFTPGLQSVF